MNFFLEAAGPYAGRRDVDNMYAEYKAQPSGTWRAHAQRWTNLGTSLTQASGDLDGALRKVTIWQQSTGSEGWQSFSGEVTAGVNFLRTWQQLASGVAQRLNGAADMLDGAAGTMDHLLQYWNDAKAKANSGDGPVVEAGMREMNDAGFMAAIEMNLLSDGLVRALDGVQQVFGQHDWMGPVVAKDRTQDTGDGNGQNKANGGDSAKTTDGKAPDEKAPDDKKPDDKQPEAKDPVEEAGKVIDVVGKGIDLIGKVPENLDKWITLAQHAKELVDPSSTTTATTTVPTTPSLTDGLLPDQPALAGSAGTTTAPTFHPETSLPPVTGSGHVPIGGGGGGSLGHLSGATERSTTPVQKSATVAGSAGAEPTLSGKSATASPTTQQSTPPMYPPQNGGMGAGGNGPRDVRPGAANGRRPGFNVPTEQSEGERLRRHGVQSELQGRTNGESRAAAGVPPLRKRKRSVARPVERDVLDEDLWRI
ncbi:hypothetical protein [Kribbella sp. NPDC004536]|uniref:hypothetical protein n=1 Tax=Kribbella sp. NPDC004536 TaxID=3364106 RepID=UPI0036A54BAF